jgi:hypothetical protein
MALGWDDVQRVKRVEARAEELGFKFSSSANYNYGGNNIISYICLKPKEDCLPHYSRDADVFIGTLEEINTWLTGVEWARGYEEMLKLGNDKKRKEKEQVERNRQLLRTIKTGRKVEGTVGTTSVDEWRIQLEEEYDIEDEVDYEEIPF